MTSDMLERVRPGEKAFPLSVSALVRGADVLLQEQFGWIWVEGEVSNLRAPGSGHLYFVLKDDGAQLPAVMFRAQASRLRFRLEEGKRLLMRGRLGIFADQGKFQLYVDLAEPVGLGAQALALEQLKTKLAAEGLFDSARKRPLPRLPRRIGVVTSPTGAAVRDILRAIERRFPRPVLVSPTRVQGEGAAQEIARAIARLCRAEQVDVVIVGRGGGSSEDLSAFNEEAVVRAIARCAAPVISAVGHEIDVTLADLAADVRASTPTAAAELAVPERAILAEDLRLAEARLAREARLALGVLGQRLSRLYARLPDPIRRLERERQRIDERIAILTRALRQQIDGRRRRLGDGERRLAALHPSTRLEADRRQLLGLSHRARQAVERIVSQRRQAFERGAARLDAMSPLKVLERGYAIARGIGGQVVSRAEQVAVGDPLSVRLARGTLEVRVERRGDEDVP
jgi:exodeoxyribonuclease VII large subunit